MESVFGYTASDIGYWVDETTSNSGDVSPDKLFNGERHIPKKFWFTL